MPDNTSEIQAKPKKQVKKHRKQPNRKLPNAMEIKKWSPGQSGNPKGRPLKGQTIADVMRSKNDPAKFVEKCITRFYDDKCKDAAKYATLIWNYSDGMPREYKPIDDDLEKLEFILWKIDKTCFDKQQQVLGCSKNRIIVRCPRRSGKTETFVRLVVKYALKAKDAHVTYFGLTQQRAKDLLWKPVLTLCEEKHIQCEPDSVRGKITFNNGSVIQFAGNDNIKEREKRQGDRNDLIIIDESQSQDGLKYLIETILEPTLADRNGTLLLGGSEPRVRETYFDELWSNGNEKWARFKWTMFDNPFIQDAEKFIKELLESHAWTADEPVYRREYLGEACFDDDALVLRFGEKNYYTPDELAAWEKKQPAGDVMLILGVDTGHDDADAVVPMLASKSDDTVWVLGEKAIAKQGITDLADMINAAIASLSASRILYEKPYIAFDTGGLGKKVAYELYSRHHLPIQAAVKHDKDAIIRIGKDRVKIGTVKIIKDGAFDKDAKKVIHARDDKDRILATLSDDYHSDLFDAFLYGLRYAHNKAGSLKE